MDPKPERDMDELFNVDVPFDDALQRLLNVSPEVPEENPEDSRREGEGN